jgi:hypothetical protein
MGFLPDVDFMPSIARMAATNRPHQAIAVQHDSRVDAGNLLFLTE